VAAAVVVHARAVAEVPVADAAVQAVVTAVRVARVTARADAMAAAAMVDAAMAEPSSSRT